MTEPLDMVNQEKDRRDERLHALSWLDDARRIDHIMYDEELEAVLIQSQMLDVTRSKIWG